MSRIKIGVSGPAALLALATASLAAQTARAQGSTDQNDVGAGPAPQTNLAAKTQPADLPLARFAGERVSSGRSHLWQSIIWGGASVVGGGALTLSSDRGEHPTRWAFGVQTAAWGAIDIGIGAVGLVILRGPPSGRTRADLIERERLYHDALVFSMGLDIAYMTAGTLMTVASYRGVDNALEWRGHGSAIIIQGAALFTIEAIAWLGSRGRLEKLIELTPQLGGHFDNSDGSFSASIGGHF